MVPAAVLFFMFSPLLCLSFRTIKQINCIVRVLVIKHFEYWLSIFEMVVVFVFDTAVDVGVGCFEESCAVTEIIFVKGIAERICCFFGLI